MTFSQLLSSMRFAISMLSIVGIASIIGTVLKQNQSYESYIIKFGQFWFDFFETLSLYNVYQASWFLLILLFLVSSTSLCVYRNTPRIIKDFKAFQDNIKERSLRSYKYSFDIPFNDFKKNDLIEFLNKNQFKVKDKIVNDKDQLIVAKKGDYQKLGYIFTHFAIIIISVGGLMDGNLIFKFQESLGTKQIEFYDKPISEISKKSWLDSSNFSFRANMLLVEGESQSVGVIPVKDGYMIQDLPFTVSLKDFNIEHYSSGQPKSFESDLIIKSKKNGETINKKISVNKPLHYDGVTIYQSDFQDGGTKLDLALHDFYSSSKSIPMKAEVFKHNELIIENQKMNFEFEDFRLFNILDLEFNDETKPTNVGPNYRFKVRNESGQASEYESYQYPMLFDGRYFFMSGMRNSPQEEFKFLRVPADSEKTLNGFIIFKDLMIDDKKINVAIKRLSKENISDASQDINNIEDGFRTIWKSFIVGGYNNIALNIDSNVPPENQEQVADTYIKIIRLIANRAISDYLENNTDVTLFNLDEIESFTQDALNAYSDSFFYGSNFLVELKDFEQVQASGLQLTKSPGQFWVYLGSIMLVIGIFCMLYIQEIRLWIMKKNGSKNLILAFASNRDQIDFEKFVDKTKNEIKKFYSN